MIYTSRVSAFLFCLRKETPAKKRQTRGFTPSPPQRRAAAHSLRLSVGSSTHSPVNSLRSNNTDSCVLLCKPFPRISQSDFKHCGSAIESLIISVGRVARFCFAIIQVFRKLQFANDRFLETILETILSKFASIAFLLLFFNCIELILTQEYN